MKDPTQPQDDYTEFEIREETRDISEFEVIEFDPSDVSEYPIVEFYSWPDSVHQNPEPQQ